MTSTQQFIPIEDIRDDLVLLKNGGASLVISTSAVNFGLLFETEQFSIISSFAGLLNSLSFPIQIVISSKRLDVSSYLKVIDQAYVKQSNPLLKTMTVHYRRFVESLIKENNVLDKQFYVCLYAAGIELGILRGSADDRAKKAATILIPRRDHILRQLSHLGLKAKQLNTAELVKLFYSLYNEYTFDEASVAPAPAASQPVAQTPPPQPLPPATAPIVTSLRKSPPNTLRPLKPFPPPAAKATAPQAPAAFPGGAALAPPFVVEELPDDYDQKTTG